MTNLLLKDLKLTEIMIRLLRKIWNSSHRLPRRIFCRRECSLVVRSRTQQTTTTKWPRSLASPRMKIVVVPLLWQCWTMATPPTSSKSKKRLYQACKPSPNPEQARRMSTREPSVQRARQYSQPKLLGWTWTALFRSKRLEMLKIKFLHVT